MKKYRDILEIVTNNIKIQNLIFNTPASNVRGSPIIGTQDKSKDHNPYF